MPLTEKQKRFVEEYLVDLNGADAARRAGYSVKTANEQAVRLLANISVQEEIQKAQQLRAQRTEIDQDYILNRLRKEAELTPREGASHAARIRALELLGKHLGMFADKHEITGKDGQPIQTVNLTDHERFLAITAILSRFGYRVIGPDSERESPRIGPFPDQSDKSDDAGQSEARSVAGKITPLDVG